MNALVKRELDEVGRENVLEYLASYEAQWNDLDGCLAYVVGWFGISPDAAEAALATYLSNRNADRVAATQVVVQ